MAPKKAIEVAHDDVLAAWTILENLAVSFDQIGAVFGSLKDALDDPKQQKALQAALAAYVVSAELLLFCEGVRDRSGNKSNEMGRYLRARSPSWVKKPLG